MSSRLDSPVADLPPKQVIAGLSGRSIAMLLSVIGGSILLRVPFLSVPMITDEGGYSYVARFWSSEYQLYRDIPFDRPQAIFLLYNFAFFLFGSDVTAIRLFTALYNALSVTAMHFLCRQVLSSSEAWVASALLAIFSVSPSIEGFTGNAEIFMLLPLVLSAHLAWKRLWFWAGFAGAMAVLLKPSGVSALLLAISWAAVARAGLIAWLQVGAGVALGLLPSVLHGVWVGWEYYWQSIHERRLVLYNAETVNLAEQLRALLIGLHSTVPSWGFLAVASALSMMRTRGRERVFGVLWLGFSLLGIAMGGWWREHYFIQALPPLVFLASTGLTRLRTSPLRIIWTLALLFALTFFVRRDVALLFRSPEAISWQLYRRPGYLLGNQIAGYVRSHTDEQDTIYVAFAEAELYYLSGRRAAVPQFYFLHAQYSEPVFRSVVRAIEERKPAIVLLVQPPPANRMSTRDFLSLLNRGYAQDRVFAVGEGIPTITAFRRKEI